MGDKIVGSFKVTLPISGARREFITKSDGTVGTEMWLHVEASGPERDSHGDRMSEQALTKMVEYVERGYGGNPIPFLDGHHRDLLASHLGNIHAPRLNEKQHFCFDMKVRERNPFGVELFEDVLAGKKHGASVAGIVHEAEIEKYDDEDFGRLFHDVELVEVSRTSWPSWTSSFIELLGKKLGQSPDDADALIARRTEIVKAMHEAEAPAPTVESTGVVKEAAELVGLIKTIVKDEVNLMNKDKETTEVVENPETEEEIAVVEETTDVEELATEEPVEVEESTTEEQETVTETEAETEPETTEVETPEPDVAGEPAVESPTDVSLADSLAAEVEDRMLARKFGVLVSAMSEMVAQKVRKKDATGAFRALDEFMSLAKDTVKKAVARDVSMWTDDAVNAVLAEKIELAEGKLSKSRVNTIEKTGEALVAEWVALLNIIKNANVEDDTVVVERAAQVAAETVAQAKTEERTELERRMAEVESKAEEQEAAVQDQMAEVIDALSAEPEAEEPQGMDTTEIPEVVQEENNSYEANMARFTGSVQKHLERR